MGMWLLKMGWLKMDCSLKNMECNEFLSWSNQNFFKFYTTSCDVNFLIPPWSTLEIKIYLKFLYHLLITNDFIDATKKTRIAFICIVDRSFGFGIPNPCTCWVQTSRSLHHQACRQQRVVSHPSPLTNKSTEPTERASGLRILCTGGTAKAVTKIWDPPWDHMIIQIILQESYSILA